MKVWRSGDERLERWLARVERRASEVCPPALEDRARKIVADVAKRGDRALVAYVRRFDLKGLPGAGPRLQGTVDGGEEVGDEFVNAVELALANLKEFHEPQAPKGYTLDRGGGDLAIRVRPVESVGVYVAGGSAAAIGSLLAATVPARIAGVPRIAVATPPRAFLASAHLRYVLDRLDLHEVYLMGGAHAIAALAYGTDSVTPVEKIVGSAGRWVAAAKRAVCGAVGVDASGGPPEVAIVADAHAEPEVVAADLLATAEQDADALAILLTTSKTVAEKVGRRIASRVRSLPKRSRARAALKAWGAIVVVPDLETAVDVVNRVAPQHVELLAADPIRLVDGIERAGMVCVGPWAPPAVAEVVAGANRALPAAGGARYASPLGVWDFVRRTAVAGVAPHRYRPLARAAAAILREEGLELSEESLTAGSRGKM